MRRTWLRLTLPLGAIALTLGVIEVGLRLTGVSYPSFYRADPERGFALRPGAEGLYTAEGRAFVSVNGAGFRDVERVRTPRPDTFRIALLGDSYTEARQVPLEETFGAEIERRLPGCPTLGRRRVEALNFGVSGYGTTQELLTLERHALGYRPDLVVVALVPGNDLRDNSPTLSTNPDRPFLVPDGDGLALDASFRDSERYRRRTSARWRIGEALLEHSRVLQLANQAKNAWRARREREALAAQGEDAGLAELGLDAFVYDAPRDASQREAWTITERVLLRIRDTVRSQGAELLLVTVTSAAQVDPDVDRRERLARALGVDDLYYAERRLRAFAAGAGIPILTLAEPLADAAAERGRYFHGFGESQGAGHWNAAGHRAAGRLIAERICELVEAGGSTARGSSLPEAS